MQGKVTVPGLAIIEGHFKGELSADSVIVKAGGVIEGSVRADTLQVQGRIIADAASGQCPAITIHAYAAATAVPTPARPQQPVPASPVLRVAPAGWQTRILVQPMLREVTRGLPVQIHLAPPKPLPARRPSGDARASRIAPRSAKIQELLH
jgi:hypothetical protein